MQFQEMQPQGATPVADPAQQALPPPNPQIVSPLIIAHEPELEQMRKSLTGKAGDAYDRVLTAGMKMLYSPQNAETIQKIVMDDSLPVANKLGEGVANLVVMMDNEGKGTIPKEVLAPVGVALLFEAADYLFEVGINVSEDDLGKALELLIEGIFVGYGIDPKKMQQVIDHMGKKLGFDKTPEGEKVASMKDDSAEEAAESPAEEAAEGPAGEAAEDTAFKQGFADQQAKG